MNRSFDALHLVNTYGAFGSVGRVRMEVAVEGTADRVPRTDGDWREYGFKGKPGEPKRIPRQFAPYHLRLDWLMWFAAISPDYARDWFGPFVERLLAGDRDTLRLLRANPFPDAPPVHVRALLYRYRFTTWRERRETGPGGTARSCASTSRRPASRTRTAQSPSSAASRCAEMPLAGTSGRCGATPPRLRSQLQVSATVSSTGRHLRPAASALETSPRCMWS